jgi:hypothetical protein
MANNGGGMAQPMPQHKPKSKQKRLSMVVTLAAFVLAVMALSSVSLCLATNRIAQRLLLYKINCVRHLIHPAFLQPVAFPK